MNRWPPDPDYLDSLIAKLRIWKVEFAPGLSDTEVVQVEQRYGFTFPPDLRCFLQYALPISERWVNWRDDTEVEIRERLNWPVEGICWDVEYANFWMDAWGPKPTELSAAVAVVHQQVESAPRLIPIYSHRYLPAEPLQIGNPVFSIYQTDIIHYGYDLAHYLAREFRADPAKLPEYYIPIPEWAAKQPRPIRFWDDFL